MGYRVIKLFTDLQDKDYLYNVGDVFPRKGLSVSDERFAELSGNDNKQGVPLIEFSSSVKQEDTEPKKESKPTKTEINRMSKAELVNYATELGFKNADNSSGTELKQAIIDYLKL